MASLLELIPSSARSSSSAASPLPSQLEPLLADTLRTVKEAINKVMPTSKKRSALEEAQWEDDSEESALEREMMMQCKGKPQLLGLQFFDWITQRWRPSDYTVHVL